MSSKQKKESSRAKPITAAEFDKLFDEGAGIMPYLNLSSAKVVEPKFQRVKTGRKLDLPERVVSALDRAATRRGVARQALVTYWIVERLEMETQKLAKSRR